VGVRLKDEDLAFTLDWAVALARSDSPLPKLWTDRVERLGAMRFRTYVAALGGALLAKATAPEVDSLAQDDAAGPRGYSLRRATEFLATHNHGRFHLGAKGRWPLNNRPFLGGPSRIDEFTKILPRARPTFELFLDCLVDLNGLNSEEALYAFAAYLRLRMDVAERERSEAKAALALESSLSLDVLLGVCERFVGDDPEGGRRGQAFVAAVLDCVFPKVELRSINDPSPGDVRVIDSSGVTLAAEVKQAPVQHDTAIELAQAARAIGAEAAILVVFAPKHAPLERNRVRRQSAQEFGVLLEICESVREFVGMAAVFSGGHTRDILDELPAAYAARMREHGVSERGQAQWRSLIAARKPS
jgi:SacI restriction endonuclease